MASLWIALMLLYGVQCTKKEFDCPMRSLAMNFALEIQPWLTKEQLQDIANSLNGSPEAQNCSIKPPNGAKARAPPVWNDISSNTISFFVDYVNGNDDNDGKIHSPFKNLETAVLKARIFGDTAKNIILRKGTHYIPRTIYFTHKDNNLLITNYDNELVTISAG
eukprot:97068_1